MSQMSLQLTSTSPPSTKLERWMIYESRNSISRAELVLLRVLQQHNYRIIRK